MVNKIAILIINYYTPEYVEALYEQIQTLFDKSLYDISIVDNSCKEKRTPIATKINDINLGFDQTVIQWLSDVGKLQYAGYWVLNSDCIIKTNTDFVKNYLELLNNDDTIGLIGTRVVQRATGIPQVIAPEGVVSTAGYIDFQSAIISHSLLSKVSFEGSFYFHGGLDLDFNIFCTQFGLKMLVDGRGTIEHEGCASTHHGPTNIAEEFAIHCVKHGYTPPVDIDLMMTDLLVTKHADFFSRVPGATNMEKFYNFKADFIAKPIGSYEPPTKTKNMKLAIIVVERKDPENTVLLKNQLSMYNSALYDVYELRAGDDVRQLFKKLRLKNYIGYWMLDNNCVLSVDEKPLEFFNLLLTNDDNIALISTRNTSSGNLPVHIVPTTSVSIVEYYDLRNIVLSKSLVDKLMLDAAMPLELMIKNVIPGMFVLVDGRLSIKYVDQEHNFKTLSDQQKYYSDYGILNYTLGNELWHKANVEKALPHFKRAAVSQAADSVHYVTSILEFYMRFEEEAAFLESLVPLSSDIQAISEYAKAQRDTYGVDIKSKKRFVFYIVPDAGHPWDSRHTETGIGGSEIAAIRLSASLAKLGQEVIIFNNCAEEGTYEGVTWLRKEKFDDYEANNFIDVLIVSRLPEFRFVNPRTLVYFWAHDLNYYKRITTSNWAYFDKFLILSNYHYKFFSEAYPFIPSTSYALMTNGLDLTRFDQKIVRNPKKLIYSSNPDRGLHHLFDIFEELHKWDPELELHVFGYYPENIRKHPNYWRDMPGVIYRGYTEQYELAAEYMSSKLWLYPCSWLETFCITAIEAQAAGTPAVVSDWGCLRERVGNAGIVVPGTYKDVKHIASFIEATKLLLTNEEEWQKYSDAGKRQAQEYTWDNSAATLLRLSYEDRKRVK